MTRVLLVLRRMHTGIVRNDDHHAGIDARIGRGEQRVGRHVQADMLHAAEAARSGDRRAERRFHGDLFIRRPFAVDLVVLRGALRHFCARRAGIAGRDTTAALVQSARDCLISQ